MGLRAVGEVSLWSQPGLMLAHKGTRSGSKASRGPWQLSSAPVPQLFVLIGPSCSPTVFSGPSRVGPGKRPSCKLLEGRDCLKALLGGVAWNVP